MSGHSIQRTISGSSPLTRGALHRRYGVGEPAGLIPAHAGSTKWAEFSTGVGRAHPRSRGEHSCSDARRRVRHGSSPLTRGAPSQSLTGTYRTRLIPAHAGSTACAHWRAKRSRAHPRSRGEHWENVIAPVFGLGSSPLTRGARNGAGGLRAFPGLIPAHAGSTLPKDSIRRRASGSSPLTRGALTTRINQPMPSGLIPAHAGSTHSVSALMSPVMAHPRSRGEH